MDCETDFTSSTSYPANSYLFAFFNDEVLINKQEGMIPLPTVYDIMHLNGIETAALQYIGTFTGNHYFAAKITNKELFAEFTFLKLRNAAETITEQYGTLAFRAYHLLNWLKNNKFCGCCGNNMQVAAQPQEFAIKCAACGHLVYPRISPAIIVAVIKENKILLAHSARFPAGRYSVLAGFAEPGETLEDCVRREIREEVGIEVADIRYFGSQPWPFPDSLMIAFTARYASGQITVDNNEIITADWFPATALPQIPARGSISRQLIDWFVEQNRPHENK